MCIRDSSYGVELRKQNIPIRQTLEIYRSAVRYLVKMYESVWEELAQIENSKKRFNAAEHLVHTTKRNPARFDFAPITDIVFCKQQAVVFGQTGRKYRLQIFPVKEIAVQLH